MGAGQSGGSARTVTIDNVNPVVDISDSVVQRLKGQLREQKRADEQNNNNKPSEVTPGAVAHHHPNPNGSSARPAATTNEVVYYGEPTVTAIEVRRQKEAELRQNDAYWVKRMAQLEHTLQKTNMILERECTQALDDVRSRFESVPPQHLTPPCREFKALLIDCLQRHPGETLRCSQDVTDFTHCVNTHRTKLLDEKHLAATKSSSTPKVAPPA